MSHSYLALKADLNVCVGLDSISFNSTATDLVPVILSS